MSVPSTVEELVGLVRKSGMVDEQKLTTYLIQRDASNPFPTDPPAAAAEMVKDGLITDFQKEQFLLGKWRGFTIGKYKLLERIGVGGMGQVFLCEHMFMKRRVAIKVLPPAKSEHPAALGRFYREARAAGSLEHPHIVRTHDIDQDGNLHFIVMEYVNGSNLLDVVKKFGPMDIRRAIHYIRQVAIGLDYAFRNGLIHRDVKPGNVLIDSRGHAKILDMGLAKFYKDTSDMLTVQYDDKIVLGTADYVAPEQVANSHGVDIRADIYSLGASFYFLLAGHPPFAQGTVSQKLLWHRTKDPTPLRQIRPDVPEGLAAIISKMMMKDMNQRYQTPAEVVMELDRWVPAQVPLPAPEEMPRLSPAALVGAPSEEEGGSHSSGTMPQPSTPTPAVRPQSGAVSFPQAVPTGRQMTPPASAAPAKSAASPFGVPAAAANPFGPGAAQATPRPTSARPASSPFGPLLDSESPTRPSARLPEMESALLLKPADPVAPQPPYLTYVLLVVVSVVLAVGGTIAVMKYGPGSTPTPVKNK